MIRPIGLSSRYDTASLRFGARNVVLSPNTPWLIQQLQHSQTMHSLAQRLETLYGLERIDN